MTDKVECVYVISSLNGASHIAPVKVGISKRPARRMAALQTACPSKIALFFVFPLFERSTSQMIERVFHLSNRPYQTNGEWFNIAPERATLEVASIICQVFSKYWPDDEAKAAHIAGRCGALEAIRRFDLQPSAETIQ